MLIREINEAREYENLSELAVKSAESKGRKNFEEKCDIRTDFQRDRDRILHSKSFRRLMYKRQVHIAPQNDHVRTRLTHSLEVSQIARTIAIALNLNENLTEAIALGHDLGHTPFGHAGEDVLNELAKPYGFKHNEQSIRLVELIEKNSKGLNLTYEVLDGILNHRTANSPQTLEGKIVRISDRIAYVNHDIDDALRATNLKLSDFPTSLIKLFGEKTSERINTMIVDLIQNSMNKNELKMSPLIYEGLLELREILFTKIYRSDEVKKEDKKVENIITALYNYYYKNPENLDDNFQKLLENNEPIEKVLCDKIACMTDRYCINMYDDLFIPKSFF